MPVSPKSIVYLRPDTIGDLILFSPALGQLLAEWPDARHVVVVRQGYESLAPLFPKQVEWKSVRLNPFRQRPSEARAEFESAIADLESLSPDLILAPTLNRTWFETAVAFRFAGVRSVALGDAEVDPIFAESLRLDLHVDARRSFRETVPADISRGEVENQHVFAEFLVGKRLTRKAPSVVIPDDIVKKAGEIIANAGLERGKWVAVFPGGGANVPIKSWPVAAYAEAVAAIAKNHGMSTLLLGQRDEKPILDSVASLVAKRGLPKPNIWLGQDGEFPLLAALIQGSRFYFGNDTGALHVAGAVGRPVVGVFGGGTWPRFRPSARRAISVVQPLPCFGCNWDCHFGDAPCIRTIPVSDVTRAVDALLASGDSAVNEVVESTALPTETRDLIAASGPGIAALKRDRVGRQHKIEELKAETDSKDLEIESLKKAAEDRKSEMESIKAELERECAEKDAEIDQLKKESNTKDSEIAAIKMAAEDRKNEMESIKAELEQECAEKDTEIDELKTEADTKDAEISALKETCNEREQIVIRLDGGLKAHIAAAEEWQRRVNALETERNALSAKVEQMSKLPSDPATWSTMVHHKDVHIANIEEMVKQRDRTVASLKQSLENYASGYGSTEQATHYGKLLSEKEAVIQELHRVCVERESVINRLVAESNGLTGALRKLWLGISSGYERKVRQPLGRWIFRNAVEKYWMQIGVLRQYEPRPISWDRRLPKPKTPDSNLPQIGIVTPSFGQPAFLESTMVSVLNQNYPKLLYVVQDGGSKDASPEIIARYASKLRHWASEPDKGQADAVRKGFTHIESELGDEDIMAWFNSDDLLAPRALRFVANFFREHPEVDAIYGHRIIIDELDREVGRWIMPRHEADSIEWIDYVPQETLFWRKRAWRLAGGVDPTFQFALDWDLIARFHQAGLKIERVPYFLGAFRIHAQQKTSRVIHTTGADEMRRIRTRFHGASSDNSSEIERHARRIRFRGALTARLHDAGIRW